MVKRNPNYWDNEHTVIEEVQFLTINDENQGLTRWRAGEVDQTDVPAGQYPALEAELPTTPSRCRSSAPTISAST